MGRPAAQRQRRRPARRARAGRDGGGRHRHDPRGDADLVGHRREPAGAVPDGRRPRRRQPGAGTNRPDRRAGQRSAGRIRGGGPRRHRGHLDAGLPAGRRALPAADAGALHRRGRVGLRHQLRRGRSVLLPARSEGLHRPQLLSRAGPAVRRPRRLRPGLRARPRGGAPRADAARHLRTRQPGAPAFRRGREQPAVGAAGAAGRLLRRRLGAPRRRAGTCSIPATSRKGCRRPPRSATTPSSVAAAAGCRPSRGPTARPRSASSGCGAG